MRARVCVLLCTVAVLAFPGAAAVEGVAIKGKLTMETLRKIKSDVNFTFSGDTAQGVRDSRDSSLGGGNENGKVDQEEADSWLKTFTESDDDDSLKLDGIGFKQVSAAATSTDLVGTATTSTESFNVHLAATVELKGEPAAGKTHHLTGPKSERQENETAADATIRVPPGYVLTAVKGATKVNECEVKGLSAGEDLDLTIEESSGKCGAKKSSGLGYGPAVALAAGLAACIIARRRSA